jgi:NADH-quinone oxidoreductase subunit L
VRTALITLLLLPLAGALYQILLGRLLPRRLAEIASCLAIFGSLIAAGVAFFLPAPQEAITLLSWIQVDTFSADMTAHWDALSSVMTLMVTFVSCLITIYSASYMSHDEDYCRYFCYLNLFVFFMLIIVLADNLLFLFVGWEGVGFCSYALIGFWYQDLNNVRAGRKAFLLTRIGDVGLLIAIGLFFVTCHTLSISGINSQAAGLPISAAMLLGFLLFWSATGKSAQLPLLVWLPDAMAGPTPVSALIHAATMVTAGVYLLLRLFPVISMAPEVMETIAVVGTATALYAACSAMVQSDIKKVLAYSTISQVGYMFLAIGAGDLVGSMFHLLTHAFFKSLLFLAAGCVIHALDEERDIAKMGAVVGQRLPDITIIFFAASLALGGVPPAAGFFSKGRILLATFQHVGLLYKGVWVVATITAFLTTLYTFRLFFMVFTGSPATPRTTEEIRPVPGLMRWLLWPLALLAILAGAFNLPHLEHGGWLTQTLAQTPGVLPQLGASSTMEWLVEMGDTLLALLGLLAAYYIYGPKDAFGWRGIDASTQPGPAGLFFSGFGLDRLYAVLLVRPYQATARFLWRIVDELILDRSVVGSVRIFPLISGWIRGWTTGLLSTSLTMMALGLAALLAFLTFYLA